MQVSPAGGKCFSQSRAKFQPLAESAASLCVKPAPGQVAYFAATSFKSVAILRLLYWRRISRRKCFRGENHSVLFLLHLFPSPLSLSLSSVCLCLPLPRCCRGARRNFDSNDSVRGCIRKRAANVITPATDNRLQLRRM